MKKEEIPLGVTYTGDITVNGPMFDIHNNEHVYIGKPAEEPACKGNVSAKELTKERSEEQFHFVHPEIEEEEAWRIHDAVKRLVAHQKVPEICAYLKDLKQKGMVLLPSNSAVMYDELVRLGMPKGDGFTEKHFRNCYMK